MKTFKSNPYYKFMCCEFVVLNGWMTVDVYRWCVVSSVLVGWTMEGPCWLVGAEAPDIT